MNIGSTLHFLAEIRVFVSSVSQHGYALVRVRVSEKLSKKEQIVSRLFSQEG